MNNIYILNKNYNKIGTLSNQGANPQAPYYEDLYTQELETGADTYQFSTMSTPYTQDLLEIGNHIMFAYKNRNELFTITSLEYSHSEGYKTIGVYAEGIGFDLLEVYMKRPENEKENSSGSGGSSSGGGMDNDNDGDDNTDDEYADVDDVYVDENGIIIYDKYGQDDYADPDNVSVDENGVIIYRRNKHNRKKDSLEFKNISYSRFLSILLKNTGWSYVCQPGLENIKHDITVRYDTNIYALLQDSMQSYRGVELEFVHELVGGRVQKVIKAYKDGGRGSFVGKRFEYGTNVRGITKTQEVANSEDDTVLYVDNVGIDVRYDVDFALKSAEVPEIEIGDTHYVIDRDFYPPMTIKARIGKIEISFSDPTVNKIYLANNKRISGSAIEDEFDADDVADMLDDYEFDDSGDYVPDHDHYRLFRWNEGKYNVKWGTSIELDGYELLPSNTKYHLGSTTNYWRYAFTENIKNYDMVRSPRYSGYNYNVRYDREEMEDVKKVGSSSSNITKQDLLNFIINDLNVYEYSATEVNEANNKDVDDPTAYFDKQNFLGILSEDVYDSNGKTSTVGNRISRGVVTDDSNNDGDQNINDSTTYHTYNIPALLSCLIGAFQYHVNGGVATGPTIKDEDAGYEGGSGSGGSSDDSGNNPGGSGGSGGNPSGGNYSKIICEELEVAGADGGAGIANIFGELYVTEKIKCSLLLEANDVTVDTITFPDGTVLTSASDAGASVAYITDVSINSNNHLIITLSNGSTIDAGELPSGSGGNSDGSGDSCGVPAGVFDYEVDEDNNKWLSINSYLHAKNSATITGDLWVLSASEASGDTGNIHCGYVNVNGEVTAYKVSATIGDFATLDNNSDKSLKENIRYIDTPITYSNEDLLEKADLYNFIVNQVNICEYNFIDDDRDKIGFIANDYEGTKVGDKIVNRDEETNLLSYDVNNLLFATIGALQEEVRTRDEKIASLEARLARIEAMLDINND